MQIWIQAETMKKHPRAQVQAPVPTIIILREASNHHQQNKQWYYFKKHPKAAIA